MYTKRKIGISVSYLSGYLSSRFQTGTHPCYWWCPDLLLLQTFYQKILAWLHMTEKKIYTYILYIHVRYMYYLNIHLIVYNNIINHYQYELKSGRWWHVKVGEKSFVLRMLTSTKFNSMEQLEFLMVHQWIHILAWTWWNATIFCSRKLHSHEPLEISNSLKFSPLYYK